MMESPVRDGFMDPDMLRLWRRMSPLPGDLRLYRGTAIALFLGHRLSTDFDFATPEPVVDIAFATGIPWLRGAALRGGPGMVDADLPGGERTIRITFMECGRLVPMPIREPIKAPNGVAVAHPADLVAAKIEACLTRGALRDYEDVAEALAAWPKWCGEAVGTALGGRRETDILRGLANPPSAVAHALNLQGLRRLQGFARKLARPGTNLEP